MQNNKHLSFYGVAICVLVIALNSISFGQSDKLTTAKTRTSNSTQAIKSIVELPAGQSIPAELLSKARVIAVFPNITKINLLFQKAMKGSGLASRRTDGGWST